MSNVGNKQKLIEQLRAEANFERIKVSVACKDLIKYCQDHESGDVLVVAAQVGAYYFKLVYKPMGKGRSGEEQSGIKII
ncbi:unnamed protein product [Rotaria magnacalcarata]|uniref:Guanine nucleotide-binding protein subunit gamma n=1 Tax=Rotaria magnacalcarata TaxID=392030 RepID=A0A816UFJ3_9BILA|nr:unnamed protein product [Rotaria magnacalcarata]